MTPRWCQCPDYEPHPSNRANCCGRCLKRVNPDCESNDATFAEFFDQLAALPDVPGWFIEAIRARELAGRDTFGNTFLARANAAEGIEEAADLALYSRLHLLAQRHRGLPEDTRLALEAAHHAAKAAECLARLHHG